MSVIKVAINGFGTIGKRVADAVDAQDDMEIVGVTKTGPSFGCDLAVKKGFPLYCTFDDADRMIIGIIQCMILIVLAIIGNQLEFGWIYFTALIAVAGFSVYQQYLIKDRIPDKCFQAFLNNNWFGATVFFGIVMDYLIQ